MKIPLPLLACGLLSIAALYLNAGNFWGLPVIGALLILAAFSPWRIPSSFWTIWGLRTAAVLLVLILMGAPNSEIAQWYVKPEYTSRAGVLAALELVLRSWRKHSTSTRSLGDQLLVSGLILMAACNTFDRTTVSIIAPLWLISALAVIRRINAFEMPPPQSAPTPSPTPSAPIINSPRLRPHLPRYIALAIALAIGLGGVSAVQFFDQQVSNWAVNFLQGQLSPSRSQIGLGLSPRLQSIFNPSATPTRVLRLEGFMGERHLRVMAYWAYVDGAWLPRPNERTFRLVSPAILRGRPTPDNPSRLMRIVALSPDIQNVLAIPVDAIGIEAFSGTGSAPIERDPTFSLRVVRGATATAWDVRFAGDGISCPLLPPPDPEEREALTWWPDEVDPRVRDLAISVAGNGEPIDKVARISAYLRSNNAYSLEFQPDGEPLSDFILNRRAAHCQYFASAVVVMARAVGLPSRFVGGFYAHEPDDQSTIVRQRDAHAWAEVYIDGQGWITVDATPAGGRPASLFAEVGTARRLWEWFTDLPERLRDYLAELGLTRIVLAIALLGALVLTFRLLRAWWRSRNTQPDPSSLHPSDPRLLLAARQFQAYLSRHNIPCPPGKTWTEHVANLPHLTPQLTPFLQAYNRARFGQADPSHLLPLLPQSPPPPTPPPNTQPTPP